MDDSASFMPQADATHTLVIGSGFGGIAAALRMRALGHQVTLVERLDAIGGRAQSFEHQGFRHDAGPTVITAPFLFDELFELFGERREDYLDFRPLDPWYRFQFHDGQSFDYRPGLTIRMMKLRNFRLKMCKIMTGWLRHHARFLILAFPDWQTGRSPNLPR